VLLVPLASGDRSCTSGIDIQEPGGLEKARAEKYTVHEEKKKIHCRKKRSVAGKGEGLGKELLEKQFYVEEGGKHIPAKRPAEKVIASLVIQTSIGGGSILDVRPPMVGKNIRRRRGKMDVKLSETVGM